MVVLCINGATHTVAHTHTHTHRTPGGGGIAGGAVCIEDGAKSGIPVAQGLESGGNAVFGPLRFTRAETAVDQLQSALDTAAHPIPRLPIVPERCLRRFCL